MNKIIFSIAFLMLLVFFTIAKAQEVKTYTQSMDSILKSVDKKQMQTTILYDRVFPFANLKQKRDTTDFEYFRQAYSELYRASYNPKFKSVYEIYSKTNNTRELQTMPIGILDARIEIINETKVEKR